MLLERGTGASYMTVRRWGKKFGSEYARRLRRKRPSPATIPHEPGSLVMLQAVLCINL